MNLIVAADKNWAIGKAGDLIYSIPEDMKYFRRMTQGKTVVMGRKTLESFPNGKPLKNRTNIVLSKNPDFIPVFPIEPISSLSARKHMAVFFGASVSRIALSAV